MGGPVTGYGALASFILGQPPRLGATRLVAVDGPSGAGKSYFAERLSAALGGPPLIHTDDLLDGWADQFSFWDKLELAVLRPLRRGEGGGFSAYDWVAGRRGGVRVEVPAAAVVIVEGVSSSRAQVADELTLAVFVTAPDEVRVARSVARDGEELQAVMDRWRAAEDDFFTRDRTRERAGLVVDGTAEFGVPSRP